MKLFLNNNLIHAKEAMVSVFDHGFLYGIGLFETFRTYNGIPFLLDEHLTRLQQGCEQLGIKYVIDKSTLLVQIAELLDEHHLDDGYFRLTVTAGEGELGLPSTDYCNPTIMLMTKALPPDKTEQEWRKGKTAVCLNTRRNSPEGTIRYKSLHYMNNMLAKRELRLQVDSKYAQAEGLMLNDNNQLTEGIVSNLFFRKGEMVCTPAINTGILPGVTRAYVLRLCKQEQLSVEEGYYSWSDLESADEIWLTNSIQEIMPVTCLVKSNGEQLTVSHGTAGDYTARLYNTFHRNKPRNN